FSGLPSRGHLAVAVGVAFADDDSLAPPPLSQAWTTQEAASASTTRKRERAPKCMGDPLPRFRDARVKNRRVADRAAIYRPQRKQGRWRDAGRTAGSSSPRSLFDVAKF